MHDHTTTTTVADLARAIAPHMPDGWQTVETPYDHGARIVGPDGARVWMRREGHGPFNPGRLSITGGYPDGASYSDGDTHNVDAGAITVRADRDPRAIAREIERRLLPTAVAAWVTVSDRIARRRAAADARQVLARELAGLMGGNAREWRGEWQAETPQSLRSSSGRYTYGHMSPDYAAADVTVELRNLSPDQARELAAIVRRWAYDARA